MDLQQLFCIVIYVTDIINHFIFSLQFGHVTCFLIDTGMRHCEAVSREYLLCGENAAFLKMNLLTSCSLHCVSYFLVLTTCVSCF